jgi:hypothetical protein
MLSDFCTQEASGDMSEPHMCRATGTLDVKEEQHRQELGPWSLNSNRPEFKVHLHHL